MLEQKSSRVGERNPRHELVWQVLHPQGRKVEDMALREEGWWIC